MPEIPTILDEIFDNTDYPWNFQGSGIYLPSGIGLFPTFTTTATKTVRYVATKHALGATPGAVTLKNLSTLVEYGPFALSREGDWSPQSHVYSSLTGISIPAGQYMVVDDDPNTWTYGKQDLTATTFRAQALATIAGL